MSKYTFDNELADHLKDEEKGECFTCGEETKEGKDYCCEKCALDNN
jgi:hypothetical protein